MKHRENAAEQMHLTVRQPEKIHSLLSVLSDIERISEVVSEDRSQDMGAGAGSFAGDDSSSVVIKSQRKQAVQSLPSASAMRQKLTTHLQKEVRQLERQAKHLARSGKKGAAYALNELYARIRKIQALIADIAQAAEEIIRRLYIRLFIDGQELV